MERLDPYLKQIPEGEIADTAELESLLAECWDEFSGGNGGMEAKKLHGRMEGVFWKPPILEFVIERHGGTAIGSSRAELQRWTLDVEKKTRKLGSHGYRQLYRRQTPLDIKPIADELTRLITSGSCDDWLKWSGDERVQIRTGRIFPDDSASKDTVKERGKRLRKDLAERLAPHGWIRIRAWWQKEK